MNYGLRVIGGRTSRFELDSIAPDSCVLTHFGGLAQAAWAQSGQSVGLIYGIERRLLID